MRKLTIFLALTIAWAILVFSLWGQTTTPTTEIFTQGTVRLIKYSFYSDGAGVDSCRTVQAYSGQAIRLVTIPDTGSYTPADNYDVRINDDQGVDILNGHGANRDSANTEYLPVDSLGSCALSRLTFCVYNIGSRNKGTIYLWIKP